MYRTTTIVTPAVDTNLTTLANLKATFNITSTNDDVFLTRQIRVASSIIANYTNRAFSEQTYRDDFKSFWGPLWAYDTSWNQGAVWSTGAVTGFGLMLANVPVSAILAIVEDGVTIASSDYSLEANPGGGPSDYGVVYRLDGGGLREPWSFSALSITYVAGWKLPNATMPTLPAEIEQAAILMVLASRQAGRLSYTDRDPFVRSETAEGIGRIDYGQTPIGANTSGSLGSMPQSVVDMLAPYCIPIIA